MRKIAFILSLLFLAYSLSMCKNIFSATSDTVNETYLSLILSGTGQTTCYDASGTEIPCAGTGQDGEYRRGASWPSPRFIDNGNGTVTDRLTGLIWQQNGSTSGAVNWQGALNYVKTLTTGGYTDWRLPNVNELISLMMHYGQANPAAWLNTQGFNNSIQSTGYWSSTTDSSNTNFVWIYNTSSKAPSTNGRNVTTYYAIAVRGNGNGGAINIAKTGQTTCYNPTCTSNCTTVPCAGTGQDGEYRRGVPWPSPRFIDNGNGTVTDRLTGLIWVKDGNLMASRDPGFDDDVPAGDGRVTWQSALNYIAKLNQERYLGYSDWRLPNVSELRSLLHYGLPDSAAWLNTQGFNGLSPSNYDYWSGSTSVNDTANAWSVEMKTDIVRNDKKATLYYYYVLAVRGGY